MPTGQAYAFFYDEGSMPEIEANIPGIRNAFNTPAELEIILNEGVNPSEFNDDIELMEIASQALEEGMNYTIIARNSKADNRETARQLGEIMNGFHYLQGRKDFIEGVIYKAESTGEYRRPD